MLADGIAIGLEAFLNNSATAYFKKHKVLPPRDLAIASVSVPSGPASFENLLQAMKKSKQASFLVYAHGHSDGSGLYIKLASRKGGPIGQQTTFNNLELIIRLGEGDKPPNDRDLKFLGINKDELNRLTSLMQDMRNKNIDAIEFRGCNLGRNPSSMKNFKDFFGTKNFGAPDLYSFFGTSPVQIGQKLVDENEKRLPKMKDLDWHIYRYSFEQPAGILISNIATDGELKAKAGAIVADSVATVQRWVKKYVDANSTYEATERSVSLHGMWDTGKRKIDVKELENAPLGADVKVVEPNMILPIGSDDYKNHVIYV